MRHKTVLIGSDMNAYYMARCYHEKYEDPVDLIATEPIRFTENSSIVNITYHSNLKESKAFVEILTEYGKANSARGKILLIPCHDVYVRLIVENAEALRPYFEFNCPTLDIINTFLVKETFYERYKDSALSFAKTVYYDCALKDTAPIPTDLYYPLIIKPSNGIEYNRHHFEGQPKVFKATTPDRAIEFINRVKASGYTDSLVVQEFIPGDDTHLFDCVFYVNTKGKAELATFAQIGLQEHGPTALGNCTVLINGYNQFGKTKETVEILKNFLESIHYTGFAEFDLKYDTRDKTFKVLEINPRQARCSYYLAALGHNLITYLTEDIFDGKEQDFILEEKKMLLSMVPKCVIRKHITNEDYKAEAFALYRAHKVCDPLKYKFDRPFKRRVYLLLRAGSYIKKYRQFKNTI